MKLHWKRADPSSSVWVSSPVFVRLSPTGKEHAVIYRIDGRQRAHEGYRVDRGGLMGWEAIDGGQGASNLVDARLLAKRHLAAIQKQETLVPKLERDRARRGRR